MTLVVPAEFAHVIHSLTLSGDADPFAITYGIGIQDTPVADPNALALRLGQLWDTHIGPTMPNLLTLSETVVSIGTIDPLPPILGIDTVAKAGDGGSSALVPQNVAFLIHKRTGSGGRTGRGRLYHPGVNEAAVNHIGEVDATTKATLQTAFTNWLAAIAADADVTGMVLLHDSAGAGAALDPTPITALQVDARVATQRRRLRK